MKIIYIRESLAQSLISDTYTYGGMFGLWYLNHRFCGGSLVIDATVSLFVLVGITASGKKRYAPREAIEVLRELTRDEPAGAGKEG